MNRFFLFFLLCFAATVVNAQTVLKSDQFKHYIDGFNGDKETVKQFHPNVGWAGKHNTIVCAAGHHFREGRWLRNNGFHDDYNRFWMQKDTPVHRYSSWIAASTLDKAMMTGDILKTASHYRATINSYMFGEANAIRSERASAFSSTTK
jgi:hypothetical protein